VPAGGCQREEQGGVHPTPRQDFRAPMKRVPLVMWPMGGVKPKAPNPRLRTRPPRRRNQAGVGWIMLGLRGADALACG